MTAKRVISLCILTGFILACGIIEASDGDLQQYSRAAANAEAANGANALTSALLLPTDGKLISADANGAGKAPVNRGLKQLADYATGIRCSIFGNCAGVNRRTLKALEVDGTGGLVSTIPSNTIRAGSLWGGIVAVGPSLPTGQQTGIDSVSFNWLNPGTTSSDANPPRGTSIKNAIRAKNAPKYWMRVTTTNANTITTKEGAGNWDAAIVDLGGGLTTRYRIRFTFGDAMANVSSAVVCSVMHYDGGAQLAIVQKDTLTTTQADVAVWDLAGAALVNLTNTATDLSCHVMGQQN